MKKINFVLIFLSLAIVIICYLFLIYTKNTKTSPHRITPSPTISDQKLKSFKSQYLNFTLELPVTYDIKDGTTSVIIDYNQDQIIVVRNGTGFSDLKSYLEEFDKRNKWIIIDENNLMISNYQSVMRMFKRSQDSITKEKIYFIYTNYSIYKLSTTSENLFGILDQMAKSFRYTP